MRRPGWRTSLRFHLARLGRRLWIVWCDLMAVWEHVKPWRDRTEYVFGGRSLLAGTPVNSCERRDIWIAEGGSPKATVEALLREVYRKVPVRVAR